MLERHLDLTSPVKKILIDYTMNNPLSEAEYVAIVRALKPIQLGPEKLCCRDVTLLIYDRVFFIIEELHEQNSAFSLKLKEALISRLNKRRKKH